MAGDQPSGLMDIASTLAQEEIPFKLRCAICNNLAVNAFRLPCCDQAVCETCQSSLPETCPVCAHTPVSPDLCKPNKALRTTLKAFLRTEEKKREKDRQQPTPTASVDPTPADAQANQEIPGADAEDTHAEEKSEPVPASDSLPVQPSIEQPAEPIPENIPDQQEASEPPTQNGELENGTSQTLEKTDTEPKDHDGADEPGPNQDEPTEPASGSQIPPNTMGMNMAPGFGNMGWNPAGFNPMSQFMANGMLNFQNPMGMPGMTMDPMTQGMFGGYGMNMNGMNGMMGMGFDAGQGMYGGWDGSQNNMWNGGQDKFNPNAFANGMGQQYGGPSGFAGFNMSQPHQFPNQNYQSGAYGRGNFRGRGRGFYSRGRGGFQPHANFSPNANPAFQNNQEMENPSEEGPGPDGETRDDKQVPDGEQEGPEAGDINADEGQGEAEPASFPPTDGPGSSQLQGIPTVDNMQGNPMGFAPTGPGGMGGHMGMGMGYGRGGYMRGGFSGGRGGFGPYMQGPNMPPGPGVEGAPAAPRAMRQGLPNTSVLRHRGYQPQGQAGVKPAEASQAATPNPQGPVRSTSRSRSRSRSRVRSPSRSRSKSRSHARGESTRRHRRHRSRSYDASEDDRERRRERHRRSRREEKYDEQSADEHDRRTRSPSIESSRRSSRRREKQRERDRRSRRSHRSRRHRTRTRSPSPNRNGDSRLSVVPEDDAEDAERTSRSHHRSRKDRSSRYDDEREREKDRRRDRYDRHNHRRHRDRDREREKKRSRRDRSSSPTEADSHARSRRVKHTHNDPNTLDETAPQSNEPEKDPHTLEREARNRERLIKEQQRREAMHADGGEYRSSRGKRESRSLAGHRRVSYKYEDEESEDARAERVECEREAGRWA